MAKYEVPAHIEIAALKAQQVKDVDLMASGPGIPWEDRGSHGAAAAFLKTAGMSLFKPSAMYQLLRRPNSPTDANSFMMVCGGLWSLGYVINLIVAYVRGLIVEPAIDLVPHVAMIVVAPFGLYMLMTVATNVYGQVTEGELKKGTPRSLAQNVFGYATGPSLLAPVLLPLHWTGPIVLLLWMTVTAK